MLFMEKKINVVNYTTYDVLSTHTIRAECKIER
jgi:hypothetical protein